MATKPSAASRRSTSGPRACEWDDETYRGDAYEAYSYAAVAVDLEVDKATWEVKLARVTTVQDIGTAINPLLAEGQVIGGTAQALGYALLEAPVYSDGVMLNAQLTNYIIPTALDTPEMEIVLRRGAVLERAVRRQGRRRAADGRAAAAVAAAVHNATGAVGSRSCRSFPRRLAAADAPAPGAEGAPVKRRAAGLALRVNGKRCTSPARPSRASSTCCARTSGSPGPRKAAARASAARARCCSTASR